MAGPESDSAKPKPDAAKTAAPGGGDATRYVGTPAVGTSKAAAAGGLATVGPEPSEINRKRRRLVWVTVTGFLGAWFIAFFKFFLPRTLFEPPTIFKIGYPSDYALGVDTKWQQKYRIWVDRTPSRVFVVYARCTHLGCTPDWKASENKFKIGYPSDYALGVDTKWQQKYRIWVDRTPSRVFVVYARCTHLGCTPDWKASENKFKCPCHGSGYDSEGVNFEGPAPRPMDRAHVELAPDGQIIVDTSRLYQWPKGQPSKFDDPGAFLPV